MGMNMSEKILARHAGLDHVEPGQLVVCQLDMVLANDVTGPPSIKEFEKTGHPVFDRTKIALIPDHFQPAKDIKSAELAKIMRDFARKHDITLSCPSAASLGRACSRSARTRTPVLTVR